MSSSITIFYINVITFFDAFLLSIASDTLYTWSVAVLHQLISSEGLAGDIKGRQDKAVYIPHVYIRNQNKWADSFLDTNGYLGIHNLTVFL